jgi:hypothetical protein
MTSALVDAFELLVDAERLEPRLEAAARGLSQLPGLGDEEAWLAAARARLSAVRPKNGNDLLLRALRLPELEAAKRERARILQGNVVDALERLYSGIAYVGGSGAPLLDVLYRDLKLPQLRKCPRDALEAFCTEFEKRLRTTYAKRMFATDTYEPVAPALKELSGAIATWRSIFVAPPLPEVQAEALRAELQSAAQELEIAVRQARLLAQAALLPTAELLDGTGLTAEGKRRAKERDGHPLLERDPPDPAQPSDEERAEIAAL